MSVIESASLIILSTLLPKHMLGVGSFRLVRNLFRQVFLSLILFTIPQLTIAQDNSPANPSVAKDLELARKNQEAGDLKEATRYLNAAAMKVWEVKNYPDAIQYFNQSIELNKQINNASGISKINSNLGMIYSDIKEFEKSLSYFQLSLDYRLKYGDKTEIISTYINKAVVLNSLQRYNDATQSLEEALRLATEMSDANQMKSCYGMLAETYERAGNQERTIHYFNLYRTFHEMVQRNKLSDAKKETSDAKLLALQLELEKKDQELKLQAASKELIATEEQLQKMSKELRTLVESGTKQELAMSMLGQELELDRLKLSDTEAKNNVQKTWIAASVIGLVFLLLLALLLYRNYRYKKEINVQLSEQNEEIKSLNESLESQVRKRTSELQKTLFNLEKRNRDLDQFSHVISHNLRGPVANILGLGKIMNRTNLSDPINAEIFDRVQQATQNLDSIVQDLSVILKVQDNQSVPKEKVEIKSVIESVKDSLKTEIDKSNSEIKVDEIKVKEAQLVKPYFESIAYNLISNAIKYRSPQRNPKVKIQSKLSDGGFEFTVTDNGKGINPNDLEKIFQPYKRLTLDGEGKGLGLYMVRTQVETMGGTIEVTSEEGEGSSFTVFIPQTK